MRKLHIFPAITLGLAVAACSSESEEPTEQIIVREPGQAASSNTSSDGDASDTAALVSAGKAAFAACAVCHDVEAGGPSGIGPNLNGVVGRAAGSAEGFGYSEAMRESGITWSADELDAFITNPIAKVPGTVMATGAVSDAERRAAIIAYLSSLSE